MIISLALKTKVLKNESLAKESLLKDLSTTKDLLVSFEFRCGTGLAGIPLSFFKDFGFIRE